MYTNERLEQHYHNEARTFMELLDMKYKMRNRISLDEYLIEYKDILSNKEKERGEVLINLITN
jgi:hypothetical protein